MLSITDSDMYEWFKKPEDSQTKLLHTHMLSLYADRHFLNGLVGNRTNSYPGGSMRCLQILAFWLSWVRAEYSEDQRLILSKHFLVVFREWAQGADSKETEGSHETELAETLLKDFGGLENIEDFKEEWKEEAINLLIEGLSTEGNEMVNDGARRIRELESLWGNSLRAECEMPTADVLSKMKDNANLMYKNMKYADALSLYDNTLDLLSRVKESAEFGIDQRKDMEATLLFNKASTYWKLSQKVSTNLAESDDVEDVDIDASLSDKIFELQLCEQACEAALIVKPDHLKAFFRLVCAMVSLGRPQEAIRRINDFELIASDNTNTLNVLADLKRKCNASIILRAGPLSSDNPDTIARSILSSGAHINPKTAKIMAKLNLRRKRENESCTHAWRGWESPIGESEKVWTREDSVDVSAESESGPFSEPIESILHSIGLSDVVDSEKIESLANDSILNDGISLTGLPIKGVKSEKRPVSSGCKQEASKAKEVAKAKKMDFMKMYKAL